MEALSTPPRSECLVPGGSLETPTTKSKKKSLFSFSEPAHTSKRLEAGNNTFIMSNSSGKTNNKNPRRSGSALEEGLFDDEESVLVASPFEFSTPPGPPRDEVCNAKTTKAMAKIIEEQGTPDSVIRRLSFLNPMTSMSSEGMFSGAGSFESPVPVSTVSKRRVMDSDEDFMFPLATPPNVSECCEQDTSGGSDGYGRFSLSLLTAAAGSPKPPRRSLEGISGVLPPLLLNCPKCGKQFISELHLGDHVEFCRPVRSGGGETQKSTQSFTDSPALPAYVQRAMKSASEPAGLPPVAPLPMSPSMLASPTELRDENDGEEAEISTFLERLKFDVASTTRSTMEHSLQVSSDEDDHRAGRSACFGSSLTKVPLVLVPAAPRYPSPPPLPPLLPATSNVSLNSPILERSSYDNDQSLIALLGPRSPAFGSHRDSAVTLMMPMEEQERVPCKSCGRKFASRERLEKHEKICKDVFKPPARKPTCKPPAKPASAVATFFPCKFCQRSFDSVDKHKRHESVCLSVFRSRRRISAPRARSLTVSPRKVVAAKKTNLHVVRLPVCSFPTPKRTPLTVQKFSNAFLVPEVPDQSSLISVSRSVSSQRESFDERSSLELQYHMLREQVRTCSQRLRERRQSTEFLFRAA